MIMLVAINRILGLLLALVVLLAGVLWFVCWLVVLPFFLAWDLIVT